MRRAVWIAGAAVAVLIVAMQFHRPEFRQAPVDPQVSFEAQVHPDAQILATLHRSCYSCHSAEGIIPWYGRVWPASALIENDVREGRAHLDFSNWGNLGPEMSRNRLLRVCETMREGEMPLWYYRPMHPQSAPRNQDVELFCAWAQSRSPASAPYQAE